MDEKFFFAGFVMTLWTLWRRRNSKLWYPMKEQEDLGVINRANHVLEEMEFGSCS